MTVLATPLLSPRAIPKTVPDEIHELLKSFRGIHPLKRLFWELLGYERRDEAILFPGTSTFRSSVIEARLLASHESFHVYYVTLTGDSLTQPLIRQLCRYFRSKHRYVAVLVSDVAQSRWQLAYLTDEPGIKSTRARLVTMPLGDPDENLRRQARLLSRLKTYDEDDEPLDVLDVVGAFEGVFAGIKPTSSSGSIVFDDLHYLIRVLDRYPLLSKSQERSMISEMAELRTAGGGEEKVESERRGRYVRLREKLVLHNLRLCFMFAKQYANGRQDILDHFQEAVIGLQRAAEKVDPGFESRFSTYASYWIKQAIRRAKHDTSRMIRIPAYLVQLKRNYSRTFKVRQEHATLYLTVEEIASAMHLTTKKAALLRQAISIDGLIPLAEPMESEVTLIDEGSLIRSDTFLEADLIDLVRERVSGLEFRENRVLTLRFGLDGAGERTLREVGERLRLTRERIRQIEQQALSRLRRLPEFAALNET